METDFEEVLAELKATLESMGTKEPKFLLISCIDLRYPALIHNTIEQFEKGYFHKKYDQVCLAGASLAAVIDFPPHPKPDWASTFLSQVALSKKMHSISAILVLEHRTCGAYKEFGVLPASPTEEEEEQVHHEQLHRMTTLLTESRLDMPVFSVLLPVVAEDKIRVRRLS